MSSVDAREKNLSDKAETMGEVFKPGLALYCFPEISANRKGVKGSPKGHSSCFEPLSLIPAGCLGNSAPGDGRSDGDVSDRPSRYRAIEEEAYRKGFREGEMAARESSSKTLTPVISTLEEALKELTRVKKEIRACAEKEAVDLALAVAKKIVCQEISANNQIVLNVVKEALKKVESKEEIIIKINPVDLKVIEKCREDIPGFFGEISEVVFKADPSLTNGGCVIETRLGDVDARIERQLMAVEEAFRSELSTLPAAG